MKPKVAIVKCNDYDEEKVELAIRRGISLIGGLSSIIKPGDRVLLKPNLLSAYLPSEGITTHPAIVKAVVKCVKEIGGIPFIGDCPGAIVIGIEKIWEKTGMRRVADETNTELVYLEKRGSEIFNGIAISKAIHDFNVIINLPKFKTHSLTGITGSIKNLFGLVPGWHKASFHRDYPSAEAFSKVLINILKVVKPALSIMDGIVGMEGNGPSSGNPRKIGLILMSSDCVALDTVMVKIMGYDPNNIGMLNEAYKEGFVPEGNELVGENLELIKIPNFKLPASLCGQKLTKKIFENKILGILAQIYYSFVTAKPEFEEKTCKKCGLCGKTCPVNAITYPNGFPKVDRKKCIECFCCYELCPHKAVELKYSFLVKLWLKFQKNK
ncbi:MAG: DUF362 domain-containing protein [Candidatus Firestonebacteria bacterium]